MTPGSYTELFFLDEATALAAGHRPCGTCRKAAFNNFLSGWRSLHALSDSELSALDAMLHSQRAAVIGKDALPSAALASIPDGCMIARERSGEPYLVFQGRLFRWSFNGYDSGQDIPKNTQVILITPLVTKEIIARGYLPQLHPSVSGKSAAQSPPPSPEYVPNIKLATRPSRSQVSAAPNLPKSTSATTAPSGRLYKLDVTPKGKDLYAYFAAILQVTGMDRGGSFPLKKFLGNFSGHESAGRIQKAGSGDFRLSESGIQYFRDRLEPGNPQHVAEGEVDRFKQCILRGGGKGWGPAA